jgi:D-tyrosyl-tRNA(Tyr) deacylase
MRAVIQRVSRAEVRVDGAVVGAIGPGMCVLACAAAGDTADDAQFIARKVASLRIFPDAQGRMNLSLTDTGGAVLLISQFTLAADTTSGTRPSFSGAMEPEGATELLAVVGAALSLSGLTVAGGTFGAHMELELVNDGPVTIVLDSRDKRRK